MNASKGMTRWIFISVLAALLLLAPASASADFQLSVSPNPVDFGQRDGVETQKFETDLTLTNSGSSAGTALAYFGSPEQFESGSFGVENKNCAQTTGYYLLAGQSCQLTVTFRPHNLPVGQKNAQLTLDWDGPDISVPLSATIIEGLPDTQMAASPASFRATGTMPV